MTDHDRELLCALLDQLDEVLIESGRLFIYEHPKLREEAGWGERANLEEARRDNHEEILALTEEVLKLV